MGGSLFLGALALGLASGLEGESVRTIVGGLVGVKGCWWALSGMRGGEVDDSSKDVAGAISVAFVCEYVCVCVCVCVCVTTCQVTI